VTIIIIIAIRGTPHIWLDGLSADTFDIGQAQFVRHAFHNELLIWRYNGQYPSITTQSSGTTCSMDIGIC
jgi:hypothetical protein